MAASKEVAKAARLNVKRLFKTHPVLLPSIRVRYNEVAHRSEVGTDDINGLYWELGHHNIVTGRYERRPWLVPAYMSTLGIQEKVANRAVNRMRIRL